MKSGLYAVGWGGGGGGGAGMFVEVDLGVFDVGVVVEVRAGVSFGSSELESDESECPETNNIKNAC